MLSREKKKYCCCLGIYLLPFNDTGSVVIYFDIIGDETPLLEGHYV